MTDYHMGRSFHDTRLEDECPCPKEACGLVSTPVESCEQHNVLAGKTMRQLHSAGDCPALMNRGEPRDQ